jgi:transposase
MNRHPEIDLVSRDQEGDYAAAASQGIPEAIQVADRFHIYKNSTEAVALVLARCRTEVRKSAEIASKVVHSRVYFSRSLSDLEASAGKEWAARDAPLLTPQGGLFRSAFRAGYQQHNAPSHS